MSEPVAPTSRKSGRMKRSWGIFLIVFGFLALAVNATSPSMASRPPAQAIGALAVGLILITIGIVLLVRSRATK